MGRRPVTQGIGLETIGVATDRGAILTDRHMMTNVPNVYAAGDVNGKSMLAHTAYREAEVAVNHMTGKRDYMRYEAIPAVIYTYPEVACVGETEETAKAKGIEYDCQKLPFIYSGRYVAENEGGESLCKILVEKKSRRILGVHLMGSYVSEMIYGAGADDRDGNAGGRRQRAGLPPSHCLRDHPRNAVQVLNIEFAQPRLKECYQHAKVTVCRPEVLACQGNHSF